MKALKIAGVVVAVVALAASAVATGGATLGIAASTIATAATVATYASLAAGLLGVVGALAGQPKFSQQGTSTKFQTNPQSGLPYAIGRTRMSGLRIFAETNSRPGYTKFEDLLWFGVLLSAGGAIHSIESFKADSAPYTFDGSGQAIGSYSNYMAQKLHLGGAQSSGLALTLMGGSAPGWTSAHKLSGMTHAMWALRYNKEGDLYTAGVPEPAWVGKWVKVYDPRKDSTYPGGLGSHRALDESTYEWSENGALHGLTWALGRWQNGKRTLGIGAPVANIRVADFVEAANVADANGWRCGGVEWSTDSKKDILKRMLQSAGAEMTMTGAMIGCRVNAPRIPIATITAAHLLDSLSIATTKPRQQRFNTAIPRFRDEDSEWEVVSGTPVSIAEYVTADGGPRTKEIDLALVQKASGGTAQQAAQLVAYEIVNSREAGPISFTTGPEWLGLKTGDCVILDVPNEGLAAQPLLIREVSLDPATAKVTFTAETETGAKHGFALGKTTTPPPPFSLTPPDLTPPAPDANLWAIAATYTGAGYPTLAIEGACEHPGTDTVLFQYRAVGDAGWIDASPMSAAGTIHKTIAPVAGQTAFEVRIAYKCEERVGPYTVIGTVMTGADEVAGIDGAPGAPGADGQTLYTWIAYADDIAGTVRFTTGFPEGRAFIGIASNKAAATESENPADYSWSQYKGPATFGLVNFNANTIVGPNFIQKVAGSDGWDASAYSSENFRGAAATSFMVPSNSHSVMAGLNSDPTTDAGYEGLDAAFYVEGGSGSIYIFESGSAIATGYVNTPGTLFQIVYDGKTITYSYGSTPISRVVPVAADIRYYFDTSIAHIGGRIENITWAAAGKAGSDGSDGAPGAAGENGQPLYTWIAYADNLDGWANFTTGAPGGRAFIGIATNKTTPTESEDYLDYTWSQYRGPAAFGLVNFNGNSIVGPNFVQKVGSSYDWDASAYTSESFAGGAALSFKNPTNVHAIMVGLNSDPTADASYSSLDYAWYMAADSHLQIYESGVLIADYGVQSAGVTMQIIYNGETVRYYHGATFVREVGTTAGRRFWLDTSLATPGARIENITWAAAGAVGPQGPQGPEGPQGPGGGTGPKGDPLFGFVQDENPGSGEFIRQTWYRPTTKQLYLWDGDSWERMLGELSAKNIISESGFIGDLVVVNAHIENLTIGTGKFQPNAVTELSTFFYDYGIWNLPDPDFTWHTIGANIGIPAQLNVETSGQTGQRVALTALGYLTRGGGGDDSSLMRVMRDDGTVLDQVYSFGIEGGRRSYFFKFVDDAPSINVTHTYYLQWYSNDNSDITQLFFDGFITKV